MKFCVEGDRGNIFLPGVKLALGFLSDVRGDLQPAQMERAMKDLKNILDGLPNFETLHNWAKSHFV